MPRPAIAFAKNPFNRLDTSDLFDFLEVCERNAPELGLALLESYLAAGIADTPANPDATVIVSGASDDLIEIEGAIRDEFGGYGGEHALRFNTGTILGVVYGPEGIWRVRVLDIGEAAVVEHHEETDPESEDYTDRLTLKGDFRWAICAEVK